MSEVISKELQLDLLKQKADLLGVRYHPSIGLEKLQEKFEAAEEEINKVEALKAHNELKEKTKRDKDEEIRKEQLKLVRIRVSCHNPNKRAWEGQLFSMGNAVVGQVTKYVPFDNDEGWHVPQIILSQIQRKRCQVFQTVTGPRGIKYRKGKLIKEFSVEILPPLTEKEYKELAQRQRMAAGSAEAFEV